MAGYVVAFAVASGLYAVAGTQLFVRTGDGDIFYEVALWTGVAAIGAIVLAVALDLGAGAWRLFKRGEDADEA